MRVERWNDGTLVSVEHVDDDPHELNRATIEAAAANALDQNRTIITGADDYLAGHIVLPASPTNAQTVAAVKAYGAQVRALTLAARWSAQQRQGLIRLALNQLDDTD